MENYETKIESYSEAKRCATELSLIIESMTNLLNDLDEKVTNMRWSGNNASKFKNSISNIKQELDGVYKNYVTKIPESIDLAILNYQKNEE